VVGNLGCRLWLVGHDAQRAAKGDPTRFEPNPKLRIDDGVVLLGLREYPVVDLLAAVPRRVADEAARVAGELPARAVLTCPARWAARRKAVLAEAAEAGVSGRYVLRLLYTPDGLTRGPTTMREIPLAIPG